MLFFVQVYTDKSVYFVRILGMPLPILQLLKMLGLNFPTALLTEISQTLTLWICPSGQTILSLNLSLGCSRWDKRPYEILSL